MASDSTTLRLVFRWRSLAFFALALDVLGLDQATKYYVRGHLRPLEGILERHGPFGLTYSENQGAAFGMLPHLDWLFTVLAAVVAVVLLVCYFRMRPGNLLLVVGLGLMLGGVLGNLCDRLYYGRVVDFLVLPWLHFWPAFNVADLAITCGAILLLFSALRGQASLQEEALNAPDID